MKNRSKKKERNVPECQFCSGYEEKLEKTMSTYQELADMDKHEMLCSIASRIGDDPSLLTLAEEIFDEIKYRLTNYVLRYEYNKTNCLSVGLSLWLEKKIQSEPNLGFVDLLSGYLKSSNDLK